jgi:hypothetical protein
VNYSAWSLRVEPTALVLMGYDDAESVWHDVATFRRADTELARHVAALLNLEVSSTTPRQGTPQG